MQRILFLLFIILSIQPVITQGAELHRYRDLKDLVQKQSELGHEIRTVDEFLRLVKSEDPEFLYNASYVYNSRSLHSASPQNPRVILFGRKGEKEYSSGNRLILSFNGAGLGRDRVEIMEFDDVTAQFELHEISFPSENGDIGAVKFIDRPESCAACHGSPAKPIWDTYPSWPGVFGSNDDRLSATTPEASMFRDFQKNAAKSSRYRHLTIESKVDFSNTLTLSRLPNTNLTMMLSELNFRRLARQVKSWPRFQEFKYALLGTAARCFVGQSEMFVPEEMKSQAKARAASWKSSSVSSLQAAHQQKVNRYFGALGLPSIDNTKDVPDFDQSYVEQIAQLEAVSQSAGSTLADWSTVLRPGAIELANPQYSVHDFANALMMEAKTDIDLNLFLQNGGQLNVFPKVPLVDCKTLAQLSAQAIDSSKPLDSPKLNRMDTQAPIIRCMSCHTSPYVKSNHRSNEVNAPYIPFDRPDQLRQKLKENDRAFALTLKDRISRVHDDSLRMPPSPLRSLSSDEMRAMNSFVDRLAE